MRFYKVSELQLKAINRSLRLLEELIESYSHNEKEHKNDFHILENAYLALDTVLDEQETENTLINKTWKHNAPINPSFLGAQSPKNGEDY
jgi:outer membrane protein assembly factor BamD (BamD/ComL family)